MYSLQAATQKLSDFVRIVCTQFSETSGSLINMDARGNNQHVLSGAKI